MNVDKIREQFEADGLPTSVIDSIVNGMLREVERKTKAKQPRKMNAFFGNGKPSRKEEAEVEVTCVCHCCGHVEVRTITMEILVGSPRTQRIGVSLCNSCPSKLRQLDHEQLVTMVLLKCHPAPSLHGCSNVTHIRMSGKYKPEDVVTMVSNS